MPIIQTILNPTAKESEQGYNKLGSILGNYVGGTICNELDESTDKGELTPQSQITVCSLNVIKKGYNPYSIMEESSILAEKLINTAQNLKTSNSNYSLQKIAKFKNENYIKSHSIKDNDFCVNWGKKQQKLKGNNDELFFCSNSFILELEENSIFAADSRRISLMYCYGVTHEEILINSIYANIIAQTFYKKNQNKKELINKAIKQINTTLAEINLIEPEKNIKEIATKLELDLKGKNSDNENTQTFIAILDEFENFESFETSIKKIKLKTKNTNAGIMLGTLLGSYHTHNCIPINLISNTIKNNPSEIRHSLNYPPLYPIDTDKTEIGNLKFEISNITDTKKSGTRNNTNLHKIIQEINKKPEHKYKDSGFISTHITPENLAWTNAEGNTVLHYIAMYNAWWLLNKKTLEKIPSKLWKQTNNKNFSALNYCNNKDQRLNVIRNLTRTLLHEKITK
jgi:hypothetical protein